MYLLIEPVLFTDVQTQRQAAQCRLCGGTRYPPTYTCIRCEADEP